MSSFNSLYLKKLSLPMTTSWLLSECMEAKGKQKLWEKQKPEILRALTELALIQSAESSNRIEGVEIEQKRFRPLILGNSHPKNRSEEEVLGYKRALEFIHKKHTHLQFSVPVLKKIHKLAQEGSGDAGEFKRINNEIIEIDPKGRKKIRFQPVSVGQTAEYCEQLCLSYKEQNQKQQLPGLILTGLFILDFLCIHPFRDGNGRVSRLLTLLLLYHDGFSVGKWISLERIVEENKEDYYDALYRSSQHWHESKHDPLPWLNYFLSVLRQAHRKLEEGFKEEQKTGGKGSLVRNEVLSFVTPFTLREIKTRCPSVSDQMIRKILSDLKRESKIRLIGRGRGAHWRVK